ncbi:MAG TPA: PIN domain-containing protein [Terracidiphilus sp.]|nr:PIN domain-containing protein [Terracidiphilus sp.]
MITFILDSSAVLRFIHKQAGWDRVAEVLEENLCGLCNVTLSAIQWGEIAGTMRKDAGPSGESRALRALSELLITVVPVAPEQAVRAAEVKVDRRISYADAFALELAMRTPEHILLTADFGFKAVDDLARIEYLPAK